MERVVRKFSSFEEAEKADREYYRSLSPQQRLDITLELCRRVWDADPSSERLARIYRVVKLDER